MEGRRALDDLRTVLTGPGGGERLVGTRRRSDVRGFGSETVGLRLAPGPSFTLRHGWLSSRTHVEAVSFAPPRALGASSRDEHVLAAGVALDW